jgi:hypothetical protein
MDQVRIGTRWSFCTEPTDFGGLVLEFRTEPTEFGGLVLEVLSRADIPLGCQVSSGLY